MSLLYYVDYMAFEKATVGFDNFADRRVEEYRSDFIRHRIAGAAQSGGLSAAKDRDPSDCGGDAGGCRPLGEARIALDYAVFGLLSLGILAIWHYPPNERFVLPLFPLLLLGW